MNSLQKYFIENDGKQINKWMHYFEIYNKHFNRFLGKKITLLEIGIFQGGSIDMWKSYFGDNVKIYAIDINPLCKKFEGDNVEIFIGSQNDKDFLEGVKKVIPKIDILIDDGGHMMDQQITTFNSLFEHVNEGGLYLCEDTHTSYWENYNGGHLKKDTFIEFSKARIDDLHGWHFRDDKKEEFYYTKNIESITFHDSIVVFEKKTRLKPESKMTGIPSIDMTEFEYDSPIAPPQFKNSSILSWVKKKVLKIKNWFD